MTRILVGLGTLVAIVHGLAPDVVPSDILPLALVVIGIVYGAMSIDPEDATGLMVVAIAVGGAAAADVLSNIHMIGMYLDSILDAMTLALWGAVVPIVAMRIWEALMPSDDGGDA